MNEYIKKITEIANREDVKEECEPHVFERQTVKEWQVLRVLVAMKLYEREYDLE